MWLGGWARQPNIEIQTSTNDEEGIGAKQKLLQFIDTAKAQEAGHTLAINSQGVPYSYCHNVKICNNELGQLGRLGNPYKILPINLDNGDGSSAIAQYVYAGGFSSSGHSAILDTNGYLWLSGCDRWQQLGLGSSHGGSSGYTWKGGKLWQDQFQRNDHVVGLIQKLDSSLTNSNIHGHIPRRWIRDVALGGDHTVILSSNKNDVVVFGKGGEGQLGLMSKPWVSSPAKSKVLSSSDANISAVCAFRNCSVTLNDRGEVIKKAGKCSIEIKGMKRALDMCRKRAKETGLLNS